MIFAYVEFSLKYISNVHSGFIVGIILLFKLLFNIFELLL